MESPKEDKPPASLSTSPQKWLPGSWQDDSRTSAFLPYKQSSYCTVLTNLQRGNTKADNPTPQPTDINFFTKAGQGEITESDVEKQRDLDICDSNGLTALHWASAYGQINCVQLLIANGAEVERLGPDGETALLLAANGGHHDVVRFLLIKGANVNHYDDVGNTPLMYAASGNHPHTCNELLLKNADITMVNHCDDTAFMLAVRNSSNLAQAVIENYLLKLFGPL